MDPETLNIIAELRAELRKEYLVEIGNLHEQIRILRSEMNQKTAELEVELQYR
jgi:hypothetical protein